MLTITDLNNVLPFVAAYKKKLHANMLICNKEDLLLQREIYEALKTFEMCIRNDIKNEDHPFLKLANMENN